VKEGQRGVKGVGSGREEDTETERGSKRLRLDWGERGTRDIRERERERKRKDGREEYKIEERERHTCKQTDFVS
jgi:hypothetical protein